MSGTIDNLLVKTTYGPVKGFTDTHPVQQESTANLSANGDLKPVNKWLGIPYAKANRFERPTAPESWSTPKECFEFGTMFPQPAGMTEQLLSKLPGFVLRSHIKQSEDSHFVNVFTPADMKENEKLPVMVYIYGGALNTGSSDRFFYDPTSLVRSQRTDSERCIVVTGNYRINIFGFGASEDLSKQDKEGLSGNYGLYDAVKIFEWVQDNIDAFGGDPQRVTAFGQSAGAFLIAYLLVSGKKLFQRAILQSGAQKTMGMRPASKSYPALPAILSTLSSSSSSDDSVSLLRSASTETLLALHTSNHSLESVSLTIEPSSSSSAIWTPATISRLERGDIDPWIESIVIGTTEDEGTVFAYGAKLAKPENFDQWINKFPSSTVKAIKKKYLGGRFAGVHPEEGKCELKDLPGSKLLADQIFVNPVWDLAKAVSEKGRTKVWLYRVRTGVDMILENSPFGIMHSMDLPLIFNCSSLWNGDESSADGKTSRALGERWLKYGVTGQPDENWKLFDSKAEEASWLVFEEGGVTKNESLSQFEKEKVELVYAKRTGEEEGDEVLGTTNEE
ncbi:uncharacterized protein JCM6883_006590 [Sporobolomyces salmoneus]|uniref:uncharacterized protein n=1 Tax=Sporobolomyces salmoneus TaxID=183962 RepID=UPI0031772574